jgi:ketosteroid isomerase-like protein
MSKENVEAFKRGREAWNREDAEALLEELDPKVEWHDAFAVMFGGQATVYRGHEGVLKLLRDFDDAFTEIQVEFTEIRDLGDQVVGIGRLRTCGRESGAEMESPIGTIAHFQNGKMISVRTFLDVQEGLEAAGLRE